MYEQVSRWMAWGKLTWNHYHQLIHDLMECSWSNETPNMHAKEQFDHWWRYEDTDTNRWITKLLEYDIKSKPTKLIKGHGLAKLMSESKHHALDINLVVALSDNQEEVDLILVSEIFQSSPRYYDIIYVLQHLNPPLSMSKAMSRWLKL